MGFVGSDETVARARVELSHRRAEQEDLRRRARGIEASLSAMEGRLGYGGSPVLPSSPAAIAGSHVADAYDRRSRMYGRRP